MCDKPDFDVSQYFKPRHIENPALRLLADNLSRIFKTQPRPVKSNEREQNASALVQVTDFLEANEFPPFVIHRFKEMVLGLRRLDKGPPRAGDEWLMPAPGHRNRHVDLPHLWWARAYAAIALDVLAEDWPGALDAQASFVAKRYSQTFKDDPASPGTVKKWRERFKKGQVKDNDAATIFDNRNKVIAICRHAMEQSGEVPSADAVAAIILEQAPRR